MPPKFACNFGSDSQAQAVSLAIHHNRFGVGGLKVGLKKVLLVTLVDPDPEVTHLEPPGVVLRLV